MQPSSSARLVRLDGLRGIAVLTVLMFHVGYFLIPSVAPKLLPGGFLGVDIFFVLSGFLMTNILLERKHSYGRFYVRRAARIFPALYLLLAVQFLYMSAIGAGPGHSLRAYVLIALGVGNWGSSIGVSLPFGLGQTWSLGVEEQLYLIWPLVLVLYARSDPRRLRWVCIAGIIFSFAAKLVLLHAGVPTDRIYAHTEARLDDFLVGALVASLWQTGTRPVRGLRALTAVAAAYLVFALAVANPFASRWMYQGGFTAVALATGVILYACLHQTAGTGLAASWPLRTAGRFSYSIYLWHPLVFLAVSRELPHQLVGRVAVAAALLVALCLLSTLVVEEPLRRLAARLSAPPAKAVEPALALSAGR